MDADPPAQGVNIAGRMTCKAEARRILLENKHAVMALAAELRAKRSLNGEQIDDAIQRGSDERDQQDARARCAQWRETTERVAILTK